MNLKKVNHYIKYKMDEWIKTLPEAMREEVKNNIFVSGGSIVSLLNNEDVNDYDVYFSNIDTARKVLEHYVNTSEANKTKNDLAPVVEVRNRGDNGLKVFIKSAGVLGDNKEATKEYSYFENRGPEVVENYVQKLVKNEKNIKKKYTPLLITSNALTLSDDVQLITRFCGNPEVVHGFFDFVHCTCYWTFKEGVVTNKEALESIVTKHLKYSGSKYPLAAMFRMRKYIQRGWNINAGQMFKIGYDISRLNLDDKNVLADQLMGVDQAYFNEVLMMLKDAERDIDRTYLFSLIEKVFEE